MFLHKAFYTECIQRTFEVDNICILIRYNALIPENELRIVEFQKPARCVCMQDGGGDTDTIF